jgi:hypothetical protein
MYCPSLALLARSQFCSSLLSSSYYICVASAFCFVSRQAWLCMLNSLIDYVACCGICIIIAACLELAAVAHRAHKCFAPVLLPLRCVMSIISHLAVPVLFANLILILHWALRICPIRSSMSQVHVVGMSRANVALMCTYDPESLSEFHVVVRTARILGSIIRSILSASSFVMSLMRSTPQSRAFSPQ